MIFTLDFPSRVSSAAENKRGEGVHGERGQEADHHGPADQVRVGRELAAPEGKHFICLFVNDLPKKRPKPTRKSRKK